MMKKIVFPMALLFLASCSTDKETNEVDDLDQAPTLLEASFQVAEHSAPGTVVGTVPVSNPLNKELTFGMESDAGLEIDPVTGEIRLGQNAVLDHETEQETNVTVEIFDGTTVQERNYAIAITNINEYDVLTPEEQELLAYFNFLALWQAPFQTPLENNFKWAQQMNLFVDDTMSTALADNVNGALNSLNPIFTSGDFAINLTQDPEMANAHIFYGTKEALAEKWPDIYDLVKDQTLSGFSSANFIGTTINGARIWVSNEAEALIKHELGHSLGLGHSDRCDGENSVMCPSFTVQSNFLEQEREVIRLLYHEKVPSGLTASELQALLSNILVLEGE